MAPSTSSTWAPSRSSWRRPSRRERPWHSLEICCLLLEAPGLIHLLHVGGDALLILLCGLLLLSALDAGGVQMLLSVEIQSRHTALPHIHCELNQECCLDINVSMNKLVRNT